MKLHFSTLPLTGTAISTLATSVRQDRAKSLGNAAGQMLQSDNAKGAEAQVAGTAAESSSRSVASILSRAAQDALQAQARQLNGMRYAVAKLRAMPSANDMAKSFATERAAMLKKILDMLRQMVAGASPAQAKVMAGQLKDIAKELASMGKLLSGTSEANTATAVPSGSGTPSQGDIGTEGEGAGAAQAITAASDIFAPASASQFHNAHLAVAAYAETMRSAQGIEKNVDEKAVDDGLRSALQEALKALRSLVAMLKSKLGVSSKDLNEAERKMKELARSLAGTDNQNASATAVQELIEAQIAQGNETAESAAGTVTDSNATAIRLDMAC